MTPACNHKTLALFFDLPPPEEEAPAPIQPAPEISTDVRGIPIYQAAPGLVADQGPRPAVEQTLVWEEALELLPTGADGTVDWTAALDTGAIRPRTLDPTQPPPPGFGLDFHLQAANPMFDAWFPHSSHTKVLTCGNCHGSIFKYRNNDMSMKQINGGEYCGACHGKVSFALTACKKCHLAMP